MRLSNISLVAAIALMLAGVGVWNHLDYSARIDDSLSRWMAFGGDGQKEAQDAHEIK